MKRLLIILLVIVLISAGGAAAWVYRDLHTPITHTRTRDYIEIPRGASQAYVIRKLSVEGIIRHEWPLAIYVKLSGKGSSFKSGEYNFRSPITPLAVVQKLLEGEQRLIRLTVVEGWTRWDIANAMVKLPELKLANADTALELMNNVSLIRDLDPTAQNLEGYLYPDTYEFPPTIAPTQLIEMMIKRFRYVWKPEWTISAHQLNLSTRQMVTAASLVETEAKVASERPLIASVIYNRLKKGTPLAVDSTIIYASKLARKWRNDGKVYKSDIERKSPYNTRLYPGLPPGPIASPGESSLEAALNPAKTDYLYYVREPSRNDGTHNFYNNGSDFSLGVQALRNWEHQRDIENAGKKAQEQSLQTQ